MRQFYRVWIAAHYAAASNLGFARVDSPSGNSASAHEILKAGMARLSVRKRRQGGYVLARSMPTRYCESMLKALTHNIMILLWLDRESFY